MVSKHVCGYEQKLSRIYDYGYTYDKRGNLVKEEEICSPTTTGPRNITIATYLYDETNRMVRGTNKTGEVSAYTFNGLGVRVGTELILKDNTHGYTDFHCQTPSVETGIEKPEVVKTDYVIDYTRLNIDQRVLMKSEQDGYDFFYTYGLDKLQVMTIGEGSNWWGQSIKKCVNMAYVHTDRLGSVVNLSDQYGRVTARADYTDWGEVRRYTDITVDGGFRRLLPEITYATHEYDDVLNQFYAKARMYDADNKRFAAIDPILNPAEYSISNYVSDPMMLVQYLYVKDSPLVYVDEDGEVFALVTGAIGAVVGGAVGAYKSYKSTGKVSIKSTLVGAAVGAAVGVGAGALAGTVLAGSATASTAAVASGAAKAGAAAVAAAKSTAATAAKTIRAAGQVAAAKAKTIATAVGTAGSKVAQGIQQVATHITNLSTRVATTAMSQPGTVGTVARNAFANPDAAVATVASIPGTAIGALQTIKHVAKGEWGEALESAVPTLISGYMMTLGCKLLSTNSTPYKNTPQQNSSPLDDANFAQRSYNNTFSPEGIKKYSELAGEPIQAVENLANAIKTGKISPAELPIEYIVRDGNTLILNTRTSQALIQAGIPRSQWNAVNQTGNAFAESLLSGQLNRNKLTSEGISTVRPSGGQK